jgi:putative SOS response-associated peptidase YedK
MIATCTILTTTPNTLLTDIHDRMPVIRASQTTTLGSTHQQGTRTRALRLLVPYVGSMRRYPVSTRINQVQNDDVECAKPIELETAPQGQLFA